MTHISKHCSKIKLTKPQNCDHTSWVSHLQNADGSYTNSNHRGIITRGRHEWLPRWRPHSFLWKVLSGAVRQARARNGQRHLSTSASSGLALNRGSLFSQLRAGSETRARLQLAVHVILCDNQSRACKLELRYCRKLSECEVRSNSRYMWTSENQYCNIIRAMPIRCSFCSFLLLVFSLTAKYCVGLKKL